MQSNNLEKVYLVGAAFKEDTDDLRNSPTTEVFKKLKSSIENFEKLVLKKSKKYMLLGDMLELGKHSIKQHKLISKIINKTKINKVG